VAPAVIVVAVFVAVPLLQTVQYSFYRWNGLNTATPVGLSNYQQALSDGTIRAAVIHSFVLIAFYSVIPVAIGLILAALISRRPLRGVGVFRTVLFLPQVVPLVVTGVAWRWMFNPNGTVNWVLQHIGLGWFARGWFGDFTWALPAVGLVGTWVVFGFCMVLFIAGISRIDPALYDAARVDGAGPIKEFRAVTLPGLRREIAVALTITVIGGLRSFDIVFVTTGGGPGFSTTVPALLVYQRAFLDGNVGSAATIAVILTALITVAAVALRRLTRDES
jgi:raffinose/stachyose/melibiose transport system permease protein